MAVTRVIYTQGGVRIRPVYDGTPWLTNNLSAQASGFYLVGVQSANFTANSPKVDVNSFGIFGSVNKTQVESSTATLEVSMVVNSGNMAADPYWLSGLIFDTQQPSPSGVVVTASGIGEVSGASLVSARLEAAVGSLPTLQLTFEGVSGTAQVAPAAPTVPNAITINITTPDKFGTLYWTNPAGASGCPQSVRASWEMPIERINCLGNDINRPAIFSRPPGTISFTAEGCDPAFIAANNYLTGVKIGPYSLAQNSGSAREVSRTAAMAVGEAASTFSVVAEGIALGASVQG